jgi:hypothetical protein
LFADPSFAHQPPGVDEPVARTRGQVSARPRSGCRDGAVRWILGSRYHRNACKESERGVPSDLIETVRWFSDTLDRTKTSRTIVGVGLFNLGLGVHDKGTARDDRLMQWTTGIE